MRFFYLLVLLVVCGELMDHVRWADTEPERLAERLLKAMLDEP